MRLLDWGCGRARYSGPLLVVASGLALVLSLPSAAIPQGPSGQQATQQQATQQETGPSPSARAGGFSASVEMVRVPVVVVDDRGDFITDLRSSDFTVQDGGTRHRVDHFVSDTDPATIGVIIDASAAMAPYTDAVRGAVMRAVNNLRPADELFLVTYATTATMLSARSSDRSAFAIALAGYAPEGEHRALFDAVELGLATLEDATHDKRSLIVVGADTDTSSRAGEIMLQQDIRRAGVSIHAIDLADRDRDGNDRINRTQTIPEIARFTGGLVAQRPTTAERYGGISGWLDIAGADISTYVKHQYLLHYAPRNPPRPGTWRTIRVSLDVDYKQVRARSGYVR